MSYWLDRLGAALLKEVEPDLEMEVKDGQEEEALQREKNKSEGSKGWRISEGNKRQAEEV